MPSDSKMGKQWVTLHPDKDLESPSSTRLEALVPSRDSRARTRSPSPLTAFLRPPKVPRHAGVPRGEHRGPLAAMNEGGLVTVGPGVKKGAALTAGRQARNPGEVPLKTKELIPRRQQSILKSDPREGHPG